MPLSLATVNTQPPEPPALRDDGALEVHSTFLTIQGEGPLAGTPAVFCRLAGCNLGESTCPACDTEYTSKREPLTPEGLVGRLDDVTQQHKSYARLVVLTGGEPFRQNVGPFVGLALRSGWAVQVETNGTLPAPAGRWGGERFTVVCSPKTPKLNAGLAQNVHAFKYILDADHVDPDDGLPTASMGANLRVARPPSGYPRDRVFVQPLDVKDPDQNRRNHQAAVASCLRHGWRLSVQIHKELDLP